jgi:hypothetical protein
MPEPSWFNKKNVKKASQKKEEKAAAELGGSAQPGSGNQFHAPGDINLEKYLVEHKYTDSKSYTLDKPTFKKIEKEAQENLKLPAMMLEIQDMKLIVLRYEDVI